MSRLRLKLVQEREEAAGQWEEALRMREEALNKKEETVKEREAAATKRDKALEGREGALLQKEKAMKKWQKELRKKEEELSKRERALKKTHKPTKRTRASAAGSSSSPRQLPSPHPATDIHDLPDEVLAKIFALLSLKTMVQVLSVCQRWRGVIQDWYLIKKLKFEGSTFTTEEASCLIDSAPKLESLGLLERSDTVALLDAASARCTNLLFLSVAFSSKGVPLTEALRNVFKTSPHVTTLRLKNVEIANQLQFCQELGAVLPDLRKLEFTFKLSDLELDALIDGCARNQMEEFINRSSLCSDAHVEKLVQFWGHSLRMLQLNGHNFTEGALALLGGCSELRRLKLIWFCTSGDWLRHLAALSHLEVLYVHYRTQIEEENLCHFFSQSRSSRGLCKLSFLGLSGVGDRVLASVANFCPQLEALAVIGTDVTISGVREVLRGCRKLHRLHLLTIDDSVAQIVPELPQLAPQLHRICLHDVAKRALGEDTLRRVQEQMPHLTIESDTRAWAMMQM